MKKESLSKKESTSNSIHHQDDVLNWANEAEANYEFSIWLGAIFYHVKNRMVYPFENYYAAQYRKRNLWTGYSIQLILMMVFIGMIVWILK